MNAITFGKARYIKLGTGGMWADLCIDNGELHRDTCTEFAKRDPRLMDAWNNRASSPAYRGLWAAMIECGSP